jgi:hypothetical protein
MPKTVVVYRNFSHKKFHIPAPDWLYTGNSECGIDIGKPVFTISIKEKELCESKRVCLNCLIGGTWYDK